MTNKTKTILYYIALALCFMSPGLVGIFDIEEEERAAAEIAEITE